MEVKNRNTTAELFSFWSFGEKKNALFFSIQRLFIKKKKYLMKLSLRISIFFFF